MRFLWRMEKFIMSTKNHVCCHAAALVALIAGTAVGQQPTWREANPEPVAADKAFVPVWRGEGVDPVNLADRPPPKNIGSLPPAPMGTPRMRGPSDPNLDDSVTLYNAETGELRVIPRGKGMPAINGRSKDPNTGIPGHIIDETMGQSWSDAMTTVSDTSLQAYPARANVKLAMRYVDQAGADRYFVCSGSMQDAGVVLTAAHCVYAREADGPDIFDFAEEIWVLPGWDGTGANSNLDNDDISQFWGWARGTQYIAGTAYINNGDWDRDAALIRLNRSNTRSVGILTGEFGWSYGNCSTSTTHYNYSYPSEDCSVSLHTGRQMYFWSDQPDGCPGIIHGNQFDLDTAGGCLNAVWGGMSGSGMYYLDGSSRLVAAVCSTSNRNNDANYCALWEQFTTDLGAFQDDTRGNTFDIEALRCRMGTGTPSVDQGDQVPAGSVTIANCTNNNPAARSVTLRVYMSTNTDISTGDTLLATFNYNNVDFGAMDAITFNIPAVTIPFGTSLGTKYIGVIIDDAEDTNDNNSDTDGWDAQRITVTACSTPSAANTVIATDEEFCDRVRLTWAGGAGATGFEILRNTVNNSGTATQIATDNASPFDDLTAVSGTNYYYWVRSTNGCGDGPISASAFGYRSTQINIAPVVTASDSTSCVSTQISWTNVSGADTYNVYRNGSNTIIGATLLASGLASSPYSDVTGAQGIGYYYFVRGVNECGLGAASLGNLGGRQYPVVAPGNLTSSSDCAGVSLDWSGSVNADSYSVYRNTVNNSATSTFLGTVIPSNFTDTTGVVGTLYYYWVRSNNECGASSYVGSITGRRAGLPSAPTGVVASDATSCSPGIAVSWNAAVGAGSYNVYRNTINSAIGATQIVALAANFTSWNDVTAAPGVTYFYWIRTINTCSGISAFSVPDTGTRGSAPTAATNVSATDGSRCNAVTVAWTAPAGATSFEILRNTVNNPGTATLLGADPASPFIDNTVVGSTVYFYWVRALSSCGPAPLSVANTGFGGTGVVIDVQPQDVSVIEGQNAVFTVEVANASTYRWRRNGIDLADVGNISGSGTDTLTIESASAADEATYSCFITSPCGNVLSSRATLTVNPVPCPADYNQDGGIDGSDVQAFFDEWSQGSANADVNYDGGVDGSDVDYFFEVWSAGGC
jgi:fibronectin type 3 domain-containing protein